MNNNRADKRQRPIPAIVDNSKSWTVVYSTPVNHIRFPPRNPQKLGYSASHLILQLKFTAKTSKQLPPICDGKLNRARINVVFRTSTTPRSRRNSFIVSIFIDILANF